MNARAVGPIGHARIDDVQDPYRTERLRAQARATRVAPASFARMHAALRPAEADATRHVERPGDGVAPLDTLRDQYTAHCLRNAIRAYHDQQARLDADGVAASQAVRRERTAQQARADAANDLGTIQGLLPLQAYRSAAGIAAILPPPSTPATGAAPWSVGPVTEAAKVRGSTDDAFGADARFAKRSKPGR